MTDQSKPEPDETPRRQRFRFNIASLILLVLMLGLCLGWFTRSAHIQREAVAAITKAHGQVLYDWQWRNGHFPRGKKSPGLRNGLWTRSASIALATSHT